jgi:cyclopropane-fatty-acyl-phospholipid synthase
MQWDGSKDQPDRMAPALAVQQALGMSHLRRRPVPSSPSLRALIRILEPVVTFGRLTVIDADGTAHKLGPGGAPAVTIGLRDRSLAWRLLTNPDLAAGEAYMDGTLVIEEGTLHEFLDLGIAIAERLRVHPAQRAAAWLTKPWQRYRRSNPIGRARANVAHHYDLSGALYDLFLDRDRQYSCAYFADGEESLEEAQAKKKRHIAAKLLLDPGMTVLDIGSGWGGLALELARMERADVTGLTLSEEQLKVARARTAAAGLGDRVRFVLRDYREEQGVYDRVVSVGMFEHVGALHFRTFFESLRRRLKPDGIALLHAIGRMEPPGSNNPWLDRYIFPGGYCPALSEVLAAIEQTGLWVTDIEILRLHYAWTLRHWFERFQANRAEAQAIYDERFCRMWEFYLAGCEMAFRRGTMMVFQIQLAHRRDAVPLTRDYITDFERRRAIATDAAT